jgi:N-acetyl-anhydromuramyl-L-alanine amidase AmpD
MTSTRLPCTWIGSPNHGTRSHRPRLIVIHDTEADTRPTINTFLSPASLASTHYAITPDGQLLQFVDEDEACYGVRAADRWRPPDLPAFSGNWSDVNEFSLQVELVGYASRGYTQSQYTTLVALLADWVQRYGIPADRQHIVGHGELQLDRSDPGPHFAWGYVMQELAHQLAQQPIPTNDTSATEPTEEEMQRINELEQQLQQLQAQIDQLNGVNTELARERDYKDQLLQEANSTIGALTVDVIPPMRQQIETLQQQVAELSEPASMVEQLRQQVEELSRRIQAAQQILSAPPQQP